MLARATNLAFALALTAGLHAQDLRQSDSVDQGAPPGTLVDGQPGGFGFTTPWIGTDQFGLLLNYWSLDQNTNDLGIFGASGTLVGGGYSTDTPTALPWSTHSLELNTANTGGSSDHIDLSPFVGLYEDLTVGTIAGWMKSTGTGAHTIFAASNSNEGSRELRLILEGGTLRWDVRGDLNSFRQVESTTPVGDGLWHHFAVVVEGNGEGTLYIDGVPEATAGSLARQGFFRYVFGLDTAGIGRNVDSGGAQWHFTGLLDDLAVWGSPLSPSQVLDLATGVSQPSQITGVPQVQGPTVEAGLNAPQRATRGLQAYGGSVGGSDGLRAGRRFGPILDLRQDETYYLSCFVRREDAMPGVVTPGEIHLTDPGDIRGRFGWDDLGQWTCGINGTMPSTEVMADRTTYFCVFRIDAVSSGSDTAFLKVYGPNDTVDASDAGFTGVGPNNWTAVANPAASGARLDQLWVTPAAAGGAMSADEFRIGDSWDAVTRLGYGRGCLGATVGETGRPALGRNYSIDLAGVQPNVAVACNVGTSRDVGPVGNLPFDLAPFGGPGCAILTSGELAFPMMSDAAGAASLGIAIPNQPSLLGITIFAQWVARDPGGANRLPFRLSDGLEIHTQE